MNGSWSNLAGVIVLCLLPFFLRAAPIEHGSPRNYVPDTHVVRNALGMAKDKNLVPRVNEYSQYPYLLPYLLLPAYGAQYAIGRVQGKWSGVGEYGEHVLEHPADAHLVARWLVLLFGALTPWIVFRATRAAGLGRGAWIAAFLVGTSLLHVQFSVQERPWVPLVFFMALAAWPATLYLASGQTKHLLLSGAAAALAFATHQGGAPALAIPGLYWLLGPHGWSAAVRGKRAKELLLLALVFVAVAVPLGHPYWLRYGFTRPQDSVGGEMAVEHGGVSIGGLSLVFGVRMDSLTRLSRAFLGYDPVIVLLGLAGLLLALKQARIRPLMIFTLAWAAIFLTQQSDHVRYLLPLSVFLAWPAGLLAERWLEHRASRLALGVLLCIPLVQTLRFDWLLTRPDARVEAAARLAELPPGSIVAIDRYGPEVDLSRGALERLAELRGHAARPRLTGAAALELLRARERRRYELLRAGVATDAGPGLDALDVEEVVDVDRADVMTLRKTYADLGTSPRDVLRRRGTTHVLLVNRRPGVAAPAAAELLEPGTPAVWVVDPSASAAHPTRECFLPTEMDFPLQGLWTVDRPGPWMALYELR